MWSRSLSTRMGICQEEFVQAFVLALSNEEVIKKLQSSICEKLSKEVATLREVTREQDNQISTLQDEVNKLKTAMDDQEQYSRRNNLRITGIPEQEAEDITAVTLEVINKSVCQDEPITVADVDRVHRLGKRRDDGTPRPVLLRLSTYQTRSRIYKHRMLLNPRRRHGTPGDPWGTRQNMNRVEEGGVDAGRRTGRTGPAGHQTVFINEDLTRSKATLLWGARQHKRNNNIKDCWSADGNILVKDKVGRIHPIKNSQELQALI